MSKTRNFKEIFSKFLESPHLKGSYGENFYRKLQIADTLQKETKNPNELIFQFLVTKDYCNFMGNMHGGAMATLLDCATSMAILRMDKHMRQTVSVDFGLSFINKASVNDILIIKSECSKVGKNLAFTDAKLYVDDNLIVSYRHVKAVLKDSYFDSEFIKKMNT